FAEGIVITHPFAFDPDDRSRHSMIGNPLLNQCVYRRDLVSRKAGGRNRRSGLAALPQNSGNDDREQAIQSAHSGENRRKAISRAPEDNPQPNYRAKICRTMSSIGTSWISMSVTGN